MTTYAINCPPGTDSNDCGIPSEAGYTIAEGPSSVNYGFNYDNM